jgi:hypothetical protein
MVKFIFTECTSSSSSSEEEEDDEVPPDEWVTFTIRLPREAVAATEQIREQRLTHVAVTGSTESFHEDAFRECPSLVRVLLVNLPRLTFISGAHFSDCCRLRDLAVARDLGGLRAIGSGWLAKSPSLATVRFAAKCPSLVQVGARWLAKCPALQSFELCGVCPRLEHVGKSWLGGCRLLRSVRFGAGSVTALRSVDSDWLRGCTSLREVAFDQFVALEWVGDNWLRGCASLRDLRLGDVRRLRANWPRSALLDTC